MGGFERNDRIQLSLADDHAAGMLTEMTRQILHAQAEVERNFLTRGWRRSKPLLAN